MPSAMVLMPLAHRQNHRVADAHGLPDVRHDLERALGAAPCRSALYCLVGIGVGDAVVCDDRDRAWVRTEDRLASLAASHSASAPTVVTVSPVVQMARRFNCARARRRPVSQPRTPRPAPSWRRLDSVDLCSGRRCSRLCRDRRARSCRAGCAMRSLRASGHSRMARITASPRSCPRRNPLRRSDRQSPHRARSSGRCGH